MEPPVHRCFTEHNYVFSTENVLLFQFFFNSLIIQHHVIWYDACLNQHTLVYNQKSIYMWKKSLCKSTSTCIIATYKYIKYIKSINLENIFQTHHTNSNFKKVPYTILMLM